MARPLLIVLAVVSELLLGAPFDAADEFLCAYLVVSVVVAVAQNFDWGRTWRFPLTADVLALAAFLVITPSVVPMWFLLLIVAFAVGVGWGGQRAYGIVALLTIATLAWSLLRNNGTWADVMRAGEVACGTLVSGLGMAYLGDRNRQQAAESHFLEGLAASLRVEAGRSRIAARIAERVDCRIRLRARTSGSSGCRPGTVFNVALRTGKRRASGT